MTSTKPNIETTSRDPRGTRSDVSSIDGIVAALYETISGPAGQARDWERQRALFLPGALLIAGTPQRDGSIAVEVLDPESYAATRGPYFTTNGFYETEVVRRTAHYGGIAQVWSSYESRHQPEGAVFLRGVNSMQLLYVNARWWIVSVVWQHESATLPLPREMMRPAW